MLSNPLKEKIINRIRSEGPINFETFMDMALYYPELGYYAGKSTEIGRHGDFYTSPHLHPIFGAMIGRQLYEMWEMMGNPFFQIVEMGGGEGYLAMDILDYAFRRLPDLFQNLDYTIIEINPYMRAKQEDLLKNYRERVNWARGISDIGSFTGCLLSNELLDSFPVRIIEMDDELREIYISVNERGDLTEIKGPCSGKVRAYLEEFNIRLPRDYRTEVNLKIKDWLVEVSKRLNEGFVMTIDYGYPASDYYSEERKRGTLLCYHKHRLGEDPLRLVGEQDITAHVNFSSLKKWGEEVGLKAIGYCEQGPFLVSLGIDEVINELYGDCPDPHETSRIKGLILAEGMGESHKVMIQYKGGKEIERLRGFNLRNRLKWL